MIDVTPLKIGNKLYKIDTNGNMIDKELSEQIIKMKKMIKYNVDGVFSDYPELMNEIIKEY